MINTKTILHIAVPSPLRREFDYLLPENYSDEPLLPGIRIKVPFGNRKVVGILLKADNKTQIENHKLKPAIEILDSKPIIPTNLLDLLTWISNYYHHPIGDVMSNALPKLLRQGKPAILKKLKDITDITQSESIPDLNTAQELAVNTIIKTSGFNTFLLDGVTGSGKTEVYLRAIEKILEQGKQALILVPEIGLTPQTISRFQNRFKQTIVALHSKLTDRERLNAWLMATIDKAQIIIGTRSAIFTPMPKLGIIIIDEEHDQSFKQQSGLRYSARDVAIMRSKMEDIPIVLGSATPSLESLYNATKGGYQRLHLPERAGNATHPKFYLVDMRNQKSSEAIAPLLLQQIHHHLDNKGQVLLFINRRGFAPVLLCPGCGWVAECERCDAKLTLHQSPRFLHCHHCNKSKPIPSLCPNCGYSELVPLGFGTERLEDIIADLFPGFNVLRVDRDTTAKKGSMQQMLNDVHANSYQILIGTQMLAKGHHFPNITMAAILNADSGLLSADFRASEQIAQLIMQVAGRAGRADKEGEVYIQTYNPRHELLQTLVAEGYNAFTQKLLTERDQAALPPFSYLALFRAEAKNKTISLDFLQKIKALLSKSRTVDLMGPIPAPMQKKAGFYRAQMLVSSKTRRNLHVYLDKVIKEIENLEITRKVRWSIDIDPLDVS